MGLFSAHVFGYSLGVWMHSILLLLLKGHSHWEKKKKKNSQAKSRTFQYRSEELRNHLFFEHKNSGALLSKAERHLLLWICDPWRFSASFLTPPSFRFPEVNAGVIFTE